MAETGWCCWGCSQLKWGREDRLVGCFSLTLQKDGLN
jgi:hypothetical protein